MIFRLPKITEVHLPSFVYSAYTSPVPTLENLTPIYPPHNCSAGNASFRPLSLSLLSLTAKSIASKSRSISL